jgi:hypothetical protein
VSLKSGTGVVGVPVAMQFIGLLVKPFLIADTGTVNSNDI